MMIDTILRLVTDCLDTGDFVAAERHCKSAMNHGAAFPAIWYNLGRAYAGQEKTGDAKAAFHKAAGICRGDPDALNAIGLALIYVDDFAGAEQYLRKATQRAPNHANAYCNLGLLRQKQGRNEEAAICFRKATVLSPGTAEAHSNLAGILNALMRFSEAREAALVAVSLNPRLVEGWNNLADAFLSLHAYVDAEIATTRALEVDPGHHASLRRLGYVQYYLGRYSEAASTLEQYEQAIFPEVDDFLAGAIAYMKSRCCNWSDRDEALKEIESDINAGLRTTNPFAMLALVDDPALHKKSAEVWSNVHCPAIPATTAVIPRARGETTQAGKRIKLGYFSSDYYNHATSFLMAEMLELHDRERFEVFAFSFGSAKQDAMRERITAAVDHFIDVADLSDSAIAERAKSLGIDIAIDLKGHTEWARPKIFAHRAAPIQINYLGYPGTMGCSFMDYILADEVIIPPEHEIYYTERVLRLPCFYQPNDRKRSVAAHKPTRAELGLPEHAFVFCCFNNSFKITPQQFAIWMTILEQVQSSVLWLFYDNVMVCENLKAAAINHGIDPGRLIFASKLPQAEHLARYQAADLFLDTLPYNAHTTASDALWCGVPVLTCTGQSFAARVASSMLLHAGMPELVVDTPKDYIAQAVRIAQEPDYLNMLREKTEEARTGSVFYTPGFVRAVESVLGNLN